MLICYWLLRHHNKKRRRFTNIAFDQEVRVSSVIYTAKLVTICHSGFSSLAYFPDRSKGSFAEQFHHRLRLLTACNHKRSLRQALVCFKSYTFFLSFESFYRFTLFYFSFLSNLILLDKHIHTVYLAVFKLPYEHTST